MGEAQLISFPNDDRLATAVAEQWLSAIASAQRAGRKHLVALSGGRITKMFFASVVAQASQHKLTFDGVEFFWADERCVPPGDADSNFRLADENLFRLAGIKPESIHRIRGELPPADAAQAAAEDLFEAAGCGPGAMPVLDLILLGMGEDGHVASLFPGNAVTAQNRQAVFLGVENSPKPPPNRVTLGHGPISTAREVWVLASGGGKEAALRESLGPAGRTPLAKVIQNRAATKVFTDIPHSWASKINVTGVGGH